jgi:hypothetical protein
MPSASLISTVPREPCAECGYPIAINDVVLEAGEGTCPTCAVWFTVERVDAAIDGPMRGATALVLRKVTVGSPWLQVARDWRAVVVGHHRHQRAALVAWFVVVMIGAVVALFFEPSAAIPLVILATYFPARLWRYMPYLTRIDAARGCVRVTVNGVVREIRPPADAEITVDDRGDGRAMARLGSDAIELEYAKRPSAKERRDLVRVLERIVIAAHR